MNFAPRPAALMFTTALVTVITLLACAPALANDDRMAGTKRTPPPAVEKTAPETAPKTAEKTDEASAADASVKTARTIEPPKPSLDIKMDRKALESLGPLTNPLRGGLGNDMWADTPRPVVQEFLPLLPEGQTIWPAQWLARRVLLSNGDVGMMKNDRTPPEGEDLFTLRLEKLLAVGAYKDAAALYRQLVGTPLHDRMIRAGILALLEDGQPAQACLEALAAQQKPQLSEKDFFWPQIDAVCSFVVARAPRTIDDPNFTKMDFRALETRIARDVPGSKILSMLIGRDYYRHTISNAEDMAALSTLERAVLKGLGRFDYSRLKLRRISTIPAPVLMTMADDADMAANSRLILNVEAAARGLLTPDQLGALYKALAAKSGAPGLVVSYANAVKTENRANRNAIIAGLLNGERRQGLPTPLLPVAQMVNDVNPAELSQNARENGLLVMLQAGITPSERWVENWLAAESPAGSGDSRKSREIVLLYLANLVLENLPTNSVPFSDEQLKIVFKDEISKDSLLLWAVFSGLGRSDQLHNIESFDAYEKHLDLTAPTDYVMPSGSLLEKIRDAAQNGRLGETALLASVALNNDLERLHPGVVQEVLRSLETVGLKEEARNMALGVILGLKQ